MKPAIFKKFFAWILAIFVGAGHPVLQAQQSVTVPAFDKAPITVRAYNKKQPNVTLPVDGPPQWSIDNPNVGRLTVAADGMSGTVHWAGSGTAKVTIKADSKMGPAVNELVATVDVTALPAEPDTLELIIGATVPDIAAVNGNATVEIAYSDDNGVTGVTLKVDRSVVRELAVDPGTSEASIVWDSTTAANGIHVIQATALDAAGNEGKSNEVAVIVAN